MVNKKRTNKQQQSRKKEAIPTLADALNADVLAKLKATKKELSIVEQEKEKKRQEQIRRERKEREDNKSFEELLDQYGGLDPKK